MPSLGGGHLGTLVAELSLDTDGLDKGADRAKTKLGGLRDQMRDLVNVGGKVAVGLGVVGAALVVNMVEKAGAAAREIKNLSELSAASTQQFQRNAYAARQFGIESDKLADIYKDVQDRVGDFLQTGAGPMADFFTNIAPQVGVTAEQFAKLSGPEALQLYVSSLEKANVSQSEMTFYLEAMAGDSSRLLPLLRDNGSEMRRLGDEAERVGAVLSDITLDRLEDAKVSLDRLQSAMSGAATLGTSFLAPAITAIADGFSEELGHALSDSESDLAQWGETIGNILAFAADATLAAFKTISASFHTVGDTIGAAAALVMARVKGDIYEAATITQLYLDDQKALWSNLANDENLSLFRDKLEDIRNRQKEIGEDAVSIGSAVKGSAAGGLQPHDFGPVGRTMLTHETPELSGLGPSEQEMDAQLERLRDYAMSEAELLQDQHDEQMKQLEKQLDEKNILEDEYRSIRESLEADHIERLNALRQRGLTEGEKFEEMSAQNKLKTVLGTMTRMTAGVATQSKSMFEVNKKLALAQAAVSLPTAVLESFKNAGGYPWGLIPAAAMAATGLAQIQAINSTSFGGGGGAAPSLAGSTAAPPVSPVGGGASSSIFIEGLDESQLFSGQAVRRLIESIGEASSDGTRVVFG